LRFGTPPPPNICLYPPPFQINRNNPDYESPLVQLQARILRMKEEHKRLLYEENIRMCKGGGGKTGEGRDDLGWYKNWVEGLNE